MLAIAINTTVNILTYPLPRNNLPFLPWNLLFKMLLIACACRAEYNDIDERHLCLSTFHAWLKNIIPLGSDILYTFELPFASTSSFNLCHASVTNELILADFVSCDPFARIVGMNNSSQLYFAFLTLPGTLNAPNLRLRSTSTELSSKVGPVLCSVSVKSMVDRSMA